MIRRVAVVEDELPIAENLRNALPGMTPAATDITVFPRSSDLARYPHLRELDCAIVDLSFGVDDLSGSAPELETGVDAVDLLARHAPRCRIVVCTRYDQVLIREMVVAVRQTWPYVPFLHKGRRDLWPLLGRVVDGVTPRDDDAFLPVLRDAAPIPAHRIADAVRRSPYADASATVLLALADEPRPPSAKSLATRLSYSRQYVKTVLQGCGRELRYEGLLGPADPLGIERFWPWCRARRPILRRVLGGSG